MPVGRALAMLQAITVASATAGYRIADLILDAADRIETERDLQRQLQETTHIQGSTKD